jgi:hypothetical protein
MRRRRFQRDEKGGSVKQLMQEQGSTGDSWTLRIVKKEGSVGRSKSEKFVKVEESLGALFGGELHKIVGGVAALFTVQVPVRAAFESPGCARVKRVTGVQRRELVGIGESDYS